MPELPEVETVRRGLAPVMEGCRIEALIVNRPDLRFPFPAHFCDRVSGTVIQRFGRRAKFLILELSSGENLIMHLGMSGRFTVASKEGPAYASEEASNPKHDHVVFLMQGGARITYNDPRRFGFMELWPAATFDAYPRLKDLGPEPLSNGFSASYLDRVLAGRKAPIKAALLDQSIIAGLGNIYVCEALYRAGISPRRTSSTIPGARAARLAPQINAVIHEAIEAGGSSISDFANASGDLGYFQHRFAVYGREGEPCLKCGSPIRRIVQSGRSSFFCGACQR